MEFVLIYDGRSCFAEIKKLSAARIVYSSLVFPSGTVMKQKQHVGGRVVGLIPIRLLPTKNAQVKKVTNTEANLLLEKGIRLRRSKRG